MKIDIFHDRIFVFTPKGDVIDLPEQSTCVDFAYAVHTDIGNTCVGAKVNEEVSGLDRVLFGGRY
jgi:GTP pyrophosphokinase